MIKKCKECGEEKPLSEFYKDKSAKDDHRNHCKVCMRAGRSKYRKENSDKVKAQKRAEYYRNRDKYLATKKQYYKDNREEILKKAKTYYYKNQDSILEYNREYCRKNLKKRSKNAAERKLRLKTEQPIWVEDYKEDVRELYDLRQKMSDDTGVVHHVDHIIPLNHPDVCGLHVPWNMQVITGRENCSKKNQFDFTYDNESWRGKLIDIQED